MIAFLIKASLVLTILWGFYKLVLEKESFFSKNRIYLIGCLFLTFSLPFITLPSLIQDQGIVSTAIEKHVLPETIIVQSEASKLKNLNEKSENQNLEKQIESESLDKIQSEENEIPIILDNEPIKENRGFLFWLSIIYIFGVIVFTLNFLTQIGSVLLKVLKGEDKIEDLDCTIINSPKMTEPCSFFHYIFINPESYDYDTYEQILNHEKIHVQKRHTIDLLLAELAAIILWFFPLIWQFRKEVEKNIEYQTDDLLVNKNVVEKEQYQLNLVKIATYQRPLAITTNYNQSLIKQRILKMSTKKSNPHSYWKYAFTIPVVFTLLLFINKPNSVIAQVFKGTIDNNSEMESTNQNVPKISIEKEPTELEDFVDSNKMNDSLKLKILRELKENGDLVISDLETIEFGIEYEDFNDLEDATFGFKFEGMDLEERLEIVKIRNNFNDLNDDKKVEVYHVFKKYQNLERPDVLKVLKGEKTVQDFDKAGYKTSAIESNECKELLAAIESENVAKVKELLKMTDANCIDETAGHHEIKNSNHLIRRRKPQTPLVAAARKGHIEIGKLLIAAKAKVDFHSEENESPMLAAAKKGSLDFVKILVDNGATIDKTVQNYGTPLLYASRNGHPEIAKYLLSKGADISKSVKNVGTPLLYAARNGHLETVKYLLSQGADIDQSTQNVGTPLLYAARNGELEVVKYLVQEGAEIDKEIQNVGTPLLYAARNGHPDVVEYLLSKGANINKEVENVGTPVLYAARNGEMEALKVLVSKGANLDKAVENVGTPLLYAARNGRLDAAKYLLSKGADINKSIPNVGTPLIYAARNGEIELVKFLISEGAAINKAVENVGTPLLYACRNGENEVVKMLLEAGADIDKAVPNVGTPLIYAARNGQLETVKILISKGADINKSVPNVGTPLTYAARNGEFDVIKYLLSKGAKVEKYAQNVGTPLAWAVRKGNFEAAEILLKAGADPYFTAGNANYAMHYARKSGDQKMIELLKRYEAK